MQKEKIEECPGMLFVIDGIDGTGKEGQTDLLVKRLKEEEYKVVKYDFPRYGSPPLGDPSSYFVRKYLRKGEFGFKEGFGPATNVNPYVASLFYALDRYDAAFCHESPPNMWNYLMEGYCVVSNRYTSSNIGFQATKIDDKRKRIEFIKWLYDIEYNRFGIPQPDRVFVLDMPPELSAELKAKQRSSQNIELDAHERDIEMAKRAREVYLEAVQLFPDTWRVVQTFDSVSFQDHQDLGSLYSPTVIHNRIWIQVQDFLREKR